MSPCHGEDRRFESGRARQLYMLLNDSPRESFFNLYHFQSVIIEIHIFFADIAQLVERRFRKA